MWGDGLLLLDANVLIDYIHADARVLTLTGRHIAPVHVVSVVLEEVSGLNEARCAELGIGVFEPTMAQVEEAAQGRGRLSLQDRASLIVCRDMRWTCISNDKPPRRACDAVGVVVRWGLEPMVELVRGAHLTERDALGIAECIHRANPRHINRDVLDEFARKVRVQR